MPVVRISLDRLFDLLSERLSEEQLEQYVFLLKGEIERYDPQNNVADIEFTMDRPDLLISEGIARAIKGLMGLERGQPRLRLYKENLDLMVGSVPTRPIIAIGVVKGYRLDEKTIEELIQFQEKIHLTVGRKRKKIAIGIHDLDKLPSRKLEYRTVPLEYDMMPLGSNRRFSVKDVLTETPQGRLYGEYSLSESGHPAILADGEIISLPPVLNSEITSLDVGTENLFIDVTGIDEYTVLKTLDLLTSVLSERDGTEIGLCGLVINSNHYVTPGLTPSFIETSVQYVNRVLGLTLSPDEIVRLGERARWDVVVLEDESVKAAAPEYRLDVLHPIDFVEDIAIAYDYSNFELRRIPIIERPKEDDFSIFKRVIKDVMVGLNFTQVYNFTLISDQFDNIQLESNIKYLRILNPISSEMNIVRYSLIPSLLQTARESQKYELPLRLFEIGSFAHVEISTNKLVMGEKLGIMLMDSVVSYEDIQAIVYSLLTFLGIRHQYRKFISDVFIKGRSAAITFDEETIGYVGELSPDILVGNQIKHPIGVAEINLNRLYRIWSSLHSTRIS